MKPTIPNFNPMYKRGIDSIGHPTIEDPNYQRPGRGFNFGSDNLKPGYTFGSAPGTMDRHLRPDGTYGPSIPSYGYITDSMGKVVAKQGDANWNDFYNPAVQPNPIVQQIPPTAPVSPVGGGMIRPQPAAPRFGGIRKVLGRGR